MITPLALVLLMQTTPVTTAVGAPRDEEVIRNLELLENWDLLDKLDVLDDLDVVADQGDDR